MAVHQFNISSNKSIVAIDGEDCDLVNPVSYWGKRMKESHEITLRLRYHQELHTGPLRKQLAAQSKVKRLVQLQWEKGLKDYREEVLPTSLVDLLSETKKKNQQKLIKDLVFQSRFFISLPIFAWDKYQMPYSRFTVDYLPKDLHGKKQPELMHLEEDGEVMAVGKTDMTAKEMKAGLRNRHRVISDFIGDESRWYCFFRTMAGIKGTEAKHIGQPHLHFISSAWGITRPNIIASLKDYRYSLPSESIVFGNTGH